MAYNNEATIEGLLVSLVRQAASVAEVIIVDNGSVDSTALRVSDFASSAPFAVTLVRNSNEGFAGGYFRGGQVLTLDPSLPTLCINPDLALADGVLSTMLEVLASDPKVAIVTAPLVDADGAPDSAAVRSLPQFGGSVIYALLGKLTPTAWRYNRRRADEMDREPRSTPGGTTYFYIEATTGALMLVSPAFRRARTGIFDTDYWMYGEDLQLCLEAAKMGRAVAMAVAPNSIHLKGVSSGWPRSWRSNREFHRALGVYYRKNLSAGPLADVLVTIAVYGRLVVTHGVGRLVLAVRKLPTLATRSRATARP